MKLQFSVAAVLAASLALGGHVACSSTTSSSSSSGSSGSSSGGTSSGTTGGDPTTVPGGTPYSGSDVTCSVGDAWAVPAGDPAPDSDPSSGLECSVDPATDPSTGDDVYCCFDLAGGSTCQADDGLTADCQAACAQDTTNPCEPGDVFGFTCDSGDDPTSLDSSLNCSADPNGTGEFCCE